MSIQLSDQSLLKTQAYINGQWIDADDGATMPVINPATNEVLAEVAAVGVAEFRRAIEAAAVAQKLWAARPAKDRSVILRKWFDLIMANQEDLAIIMTMEQGKVLAESRGEIAYCASFIEWFAEECKRTYGDIVPEVSNDRRQLVIKQPIGVVAAITPWNFPSAMIGRKAGPALAVGCAMVVKPATETPLSALALCELADRAGIPAGLLSLAVAKSSREVGVEFTSNPIVRKLTFTGSTPVGKTLMKQAADNVMRTSMELGGNAPVIVFNDADIDSAVAGAAGSKYRNSGQTCICVNRVLVQEEVYDEFVSKLTAVVKDYKLGNGMYSDSTHGPVVSTKAVADIDSLVQHALKNGATAVVGGKPGEQGDHFYEPTILTDVNPSMRVFKEEIFGPVAPIFKFKTEEEAIAMANDSEFGLASYVYTKDMGTAFRVSEGIEYGMVGVNETAITSDVIPFGGVKESGQGREGSKYGTDDYMEIKYICMGGLGK